MDATASTCALTASLQTFKICRIAFTRIAGVTIPGHFVTGYRRPRDLRLPAPRVQDLLPASRARPFQAAFHKPTKLPDANSLLISAAYDAARCDRITFASSA